MILQFPVWIQLKVPMADKPGNTVNFRKLLLNRCQKEFEKDKADDDVFEKKQKELEAASAVSIFTKRERACPLFVLLNRIFMKPVISSCYFSRCLWPFFHVETLY